MRKEFARVDMPLRRMGKSSLGLIIPNSLADNLRVSEGALVTILIRKPTEE